MIAIAAFICARAVAIDGATLLCDPVGIVAASAGYRVRLAGADPAARERLAQLVTRGPVICEAVPVDPRNDGRAVFDRQGRLVATCRADGLDLARALAERERGNAA